MSCLNHGYPRIERGLEKANRTEVDYCDFFNRDVYKRQAPKPQPQKEFWEVLEALYSVHNSFKSCAKFEPSALEICKEIECLILELQEAKTGTPQSLLCGEKEHPRNGELSALAAEAMNGV